MTQAAARPWPTELRLDKTKTLLTVHYDTGERFSLPAEYLRVESPSAEVQGHGPDQKTIVVGKESIAITALEPIGNYAIRIVFDDGHDSGLFSWDYLHELGREQQTKWATYLRAKRDRH
jgi:DUF971 family protein